VSPAKTFYIEHPYSAFADEPIDIIEINHTSPLKYMIVWMPGTSTEDRFVQKYKSDGSWCDMCKEFYLRGTESDIALQAQNHSLIFMNYSFDRGNAYLQLFRQSDMLIVFGKQEPNISSSVQRIINAFASGVPVLVEAVNEQFVRFLVQFEYPCTFTNIAELKSSLSKAIGTKYRRLCMNAGREIAKEFSPKKTVHKYLTMFSEIEGRVVEPEKYVFLHPTKSGGTALEKYFSKNYAFAITGSGHETTSYNVRNKCIIVVRDPFDRAESMFQYWKVGSPNYERSSAFREKWKNLTLEQFLTMALEKDDELIVGSTWQDHYLPTSHWLAPEDYHKTVAIIYTPNMGSVLPSLFRYIGINESSILPLKIDNPTHKNVFGVDWTQRARDLCRVLFRDDFNLLATIQQHPERFAHVIGDVQTTFEG